MGSTANDWVFDPTHSVYYHAQSQMFAVPNASGQWDYVPIADFRPGESSRSVIKSTEIKEEGEVDDDVGWGGLMEPTEVERIQRSTYTEQAYPSDTTATTTPATPKHILRLVVSKSSVLPPGGMAMVDAREGGVHIGRDRVEGQARLRIKEMEISKTHAVVYWGLGIERVEEERDGDEEEGWWIVDLGSTHGTVLSHESSKQRLSGAKASSLPHRIHHLSTITLGQTTLTAHIHPSWPCEQCQLKGETEIKLDDGAAVLAEAAAPAQVFDTKGGREMREQKRKREMALLKESLLDEPDPKERREYQDRAAMRRRLHPPSPRSAPSPEPDPVVAPEPGNTFAAGILASQGWVQGQGLGRSGTGRSDPIQVEMRAQKKGLGAAGSKAEPDDGDWRTRGKERRYNELRG